MCGRYGFVPPHNFYERFEVENTDEDLQDNYNVAPGEIMPVITTKSPRRVYKMKWGLVPFWAKDPRIGYKMINARAEDINHKPSFRTPLKSKRCLVPASGFFEWHRAGKEKTPYYFKLKDREIFAFAGLYDIWKDVEGKEWWTYTIITTEANGVVAKIHDRMPVILAEKDEQLWVDNTSYNEEKILALLKPYPEKDMTSFRVSTRVNSAQNNDPDLMAPAE
jgi:putative SOS response-associated peptidase YedK